MSHTHQYVRHGAILLVLVAAVVLYYINNSLSYINETRNGTSQLNAATEDLSYLSSNNISSLSQRVSELDLDNDNNIKLNVTLTFKKRRYDRMGSRIQLPFSAWLVAKYHNWNFCSPPDPMAQTLGFTMCGSGYDTLQMLQVGPQHMYADDGVRENGVYYINRKSNTLWSTIAHYERTNNTMFTEGDGGAVEEWRRMILNAPISQSHPELNEKLWLNLGTIRIAVHVRRGDILPGIRNDVWISDEQIISLIELSIYYIKKQQQKRDDTKKIEVHVFSEDYGQTNWTMYKPIVDRFHLAPEGSSNLDLNIQHWKHFVMADVLIVGGTFSSLPAYARRNPTTTTDGLPITIVKDRGLYRKSWITWSGRDIMKVYFPNETITARTMKSVGNNEDVHHLRHGNANATLLPIESIIGTQYEVT